MSKPKFYFSDLDDEHCWYIEHIIDQMKVSGLTAIKVNVAKRELKTSYFYCKAVGEIGDTGLDFDPCGKLCDLYSPRNGKSGCCKHRGFCYEPGEEFILTIDGKLKSDINHAF